jgi:hypothetical protein
MKHELKMWPEFFQVAWVGKKPFEIRKNDHNFKIWDEIVLQEFDPKCIEGAEYTGREIEGVIIYITDFQQKPGYVVFAYDQTYKSE